jgi:hypothetical protein
MRRRVRPGRATSRNRRDDAKAERSDIPFSVVAATSGSEAEPQRLVGVRLPRDEDEEAHHVQ